MTVISHLQWILCVQLMTALACASPDGTSYRKGAELLKQVAARYDAMQTFAANVKEERRIGGKTTVRTGRVQLKRPNLARFELTSPNTLWVLDGTRSWWLQQDDNRYSKNYQTFASFAGMDERPYAFFTASGGLRAHPVAEWIGTETVEGVQYQLVDASLSQGRERLYIGPDLLIHRITGTHNGCPFDNALTNISVDAPIASQTFEFTKPSGAKLMEKQALASLAPEGAIVSDFSVVTFDGKSIALHDLLKGERAVIIHFWQHA